VWLDASVGVASGSEVWLRYWLDGAVWNNVRTGPARRVSIPADAHSYGWSHYAMFPPPAAGTHTLQVRMWRDGPADGATPLGWMTSAELSVQLL
jgi:hypothetical protein